LISNNCVRLTMAAWNRLDPPPIQTQNPHTSLLDENEGSSEPTLFDYPGAEAVFPLEEIIQAHCPNCGPYRKADVLTRHIEHQLGAPEHSDTLYRIEDYRILKCRGCEAIYVQRLNVLLDLDLMGEQDFDPKTGEYDSGVITSATTSWPAPSQRKPPGWLVEIQDEVLRGLLEEVYEALGADLRSIAAMGIRAALDRTFELAGANPAHGFAQKLAALEAQNVIAAKEKELLLIMTDAGSAASHRGWKPEPEQLDTILAATEGLLQRVALLGPAAKKIRDEIPPRPERPKK
jgi:uncharacterized protein DUF4145